MSAPVQRSVRVLLLLASVAPACAGRLEDVIRGQAAGDLSCPEGQVTVSGRSGGSGVRNYVVSACGRERSYQAACNSLGTCVAYPVRGLADAGAPGSEDLWADPPAPVSTEQPGSEEVAISLPSASEEPQSDTPVAETPPVEVPVVRTAAPQGEPRAVTLRNECERTVALFIGDDPATGAGRYTSLGSMNTATLRLRPGEPVWLLDGKGAGLTSIGIDGDVEEIAIVAGCEGLAAR